MPAKGPLQSVQVFGRKVRRGVAACTICSSLLGWPAPLGRSRSGVWAAAPRRGRAAGLGRGRAGGQGESRRAAHVSRSGAAAARRVPVGKALLPSRVRLDGLSPESNVVAAAVAPIHSGLAHHCRCLRDTLSEGHVVTGWREGKVHPVGWNAASRIIHGTNLVRENEPQNYGIVERKGLTFVYS